MTKVLLWDLETIPDLGGYARANGLHGKTDDEIKLEMGDKFPKPPYHSIVCIGALVAERVDGIWHPKAVGAPHASALSETF